jgi:hypothetical protein
MNRYPRELSDSIDGNLIFEKANLAEFRKKLVEWKIPHQIFKKIENIRPPPIDIKKSCDMVVIRRC